jgi:hypothetical protein
MTTITTPRLSLTRFVTDDWPFFLRLRQDPQVMRFMGVLSEEALRSVFASRCADPGVFVLRDKRGEALGDIGLRISPKNPHEADVGYALLPRLREKAMPAKRCGRSAIMVSARWGCRPSMPGCWVKIVAHRACWRSKALCAPRCWRKPII